MVKLCQQVHDQHKERKQAQKQISEVRYVRYVSISALKTLFYPFLESNTFKIGHVWVRVMFVRVCVCCIFYSHARGISMCFIIGNEENPPARVEHELRSKAQAGDSEKERM